VQRPHRRPTATAVPHPPGRQPLHPGALPATQHLSSHPQQPQHSVSALHRTHRVAGIGRQPLIRRPTVPPGGVIGIAGTGPRDRQQRSAADRVTRHHRTHLRVVAAVIGHRNRPPSPPLKPPGPTRHTRIRGLAELEHNRRDSRRLGSLAVLMLGGRQPRRPRPRTHHTTTRPQRSAAAIRRASNFGKVTVLRVLWNLKQVCATVRPAIQSKSLRGSGNPRRPGRGFRRLLSCHICPAKRSANARAGRLRSDRQRQHLPVV
uniref:28.9K basic DNA-binding protein n=1 Tax=Mycobacterium scrofulaceum TaxID=1783 RepID=Q7M197_MYCSC